MLMYWMKLFYVKGFVFKNCYELELWLKCIIGFRVCGMKDYLYLVIFFFLCFCVVCLIEYNFCIESFF